MTCSCQQRARQETMDAAARAATRRCRQTGFQLRCTVARTWRIVPRSRVLTVICLLPPWGAIPAPPARQVVDKSVTLCQLKRSLVSAFALQIAGCILSSWTSGRNRRDFAATVLASNCHYRGLLLRTILALGLLRSQEPQNGHGRSSVQIRLPPSLPRLRPASGHIKRTAVSSSLLYLANTGRGYNCNCINGQAQKMVWLP